MAKGRSYLLFKQIKEETELLMGALRSKLALKRDYFKLKITSH